MRNLQDRKSVIPSNMAIENHMFLNSYLLGGLEHEWIIFHFINFINMG